MKVPPSRSHSPQTNRKPWFSLRTMPMGSWEVVSIVIVTDRFSRSKMGLTSSHCRLPVASWTYPFQGWNYCIRHMTTHCTKLLVRENLLVVVCHIRGFDVWSFVVMNVTVWFVVCRLDRVLWFSGVEQPAKFTISRSSNELYREEFKILVGSCHRLIA